MYLRVASPGLWPPTPPVKDIPGGHPHLPQIKVELDFWGKTGEGKERKGKERKGKERKRKRTNRLIEKAFFCCVGSVWGCDIINRICSKSNSEIIITSTLKCSKSQNLMNFQIGFSKYNQLSNFSGH